MAADILTRSGRAVTIEQRQAAFRGIPMEVLLDLQEFCRANETCFDADARIHARLEGRRDVWRRIQEHIHLTPAQLMALFMGRPLLLE
jgi:hypothetical protein